MRPEDASVALVNCHRARDLAGRTFLVGEEAIK
jgi:hypothetical protein